MIDLNRYQIYFAPLQMGKSLLRGELLTTGDKAMFDFKELFACEFGDKYNDKHSFKEETPNATKVGFFFDTPNRVCHDVSFYGGDQMMMGGDRVLVIADHPDATPEDGGVVGVMQWLNGTGHARLSMFVNDLPVDPSPPMAQDNTQQEPYPKPRTTWLKNGCRYYGTYYRLVISEVQEPTPLPLQYICNDNPEDQTELPPGTVGTPLDINGVKGVWYKL